MRYWGAILIARGSQGAHVSASDITYGVLRDTPEITSYPHPYWSREPEEVEVEHDGAMHMYLMADTEEMALEIASAGFCDVAGVWDVTGLLAWAGQRHKEWRTMRDIEIAAKNAIPVAYPVPVQAALL